jgi:membrane-bound serine protease (ClpP class)
MNQFLLAGFGLTIMAAGIGLIAVLGVRLMRLSRSVKLDSQPAGLVGMRGRAESAIAPEGWVFVRGELWRASSRIPISAGQSVMVSGVTGLMLMVESQAGSVPQR